MVKPAQTGVATGADYADVDAPEGTTIADLAQALRAPVLVVAAAGLGTLNHAALTYEALAARGIISKGVVIGSWPRHPGLAEFLDVALAGLGPWLGGAR